MRADAFHLNAAWAVNAPSTYLNCQLYDQMWVGIWTIRNYVTSGGDYIFFFYLVNAHESWETRLIDDEEAYQKKTRAINLSITICSVA